jgi:hypothetical protein
MFLEENENLVTDVTENVDEQATEELVEAEKDVEEDTTTEEQPKMYTEEELNDRVDELLAKKLKRQENKIRKEYEKKYSDYREVETVLNAGLGTSNIREAKENLEQFYTKKGVTVPKYEPDYNEYDMEAGAEKEALSIIDAGYEDIVEETDRLASIGVKDMSPRDKIIFGKLASERQRIEDEKALASLGISRSAINGEEFNEFSKKLNPNLSLKEKYEMYLAQKPKKQIEKMGSMKSGQSSKIKDHYTAEEIERLTDEDLDNPQIWEAVRKSMTGQS